MKPKTKKILREIGLILFMALGALSGLSIATAPFWWYEPPAVVSRLALAVFLGFVVFFTAVSVHDDYELIVRVERRRK